MSIMKHEGEFDDMHPSFRNGIRMRNCPFCANKLEVKTKVVGNGKIGYYPACSNPDCTVKGPTFLTEEDAVKWWSETHDFIGRYKNRIE